jgi:hypothetical protein
MRAALLAGLALAVAPVLANAEEGPATLKANSYAHHLIEAAAARHSDVERISVYAKPTGAKAAVVVASTAGGIGQPAPAAALAAAQGPAKALKTGGRLTVVQPLKDVEGQPIGALEIVYKPAASADEKARLAEAAQIRDEMGRRTAHAGNLLDAWPYDPGFNDRTFAQALVDRTMAKHPEVIILAVHATPPGSKTDVILGSNIGRIGKKADEDDLRVIEKGSINKEVNETGRRFEAEIPLNDAKGQRIGALGVVFRYHAGEDKEALVKKAEAIRDEMAREITSPAVLVRKS